ncbi:MAG: DUF916 and DUF3324 domain-containing protein [Lactobacillus sp.]|nr:DUF916 and DUF3324 domain-containing protein [Lactobacillus sp.]
MLKKRMILYCLLSIGLLGFVEPTYADSDFSSFSVEGIPNENQLDADAGYFYLREDPGSQDKVKIDVKNTSSEEKTFIVKVTDANTNSNGLIDYTGHISNAKELKNPLTKVAYPNQQEVKIPKNSNKEVTININMPKESNPGILMGGIVVSEKKEDDTKKKKMSIGNTYSYTLGILLTNENNIEFNKNISVQLTNVQAKLSDGRKIIEANILNNNPYVFGKATVTGKVLKEKNLEVVKEKTQNDVNIAPYSVFPFQIDYQKSDLSSGSYIFEGEVKTKEKTWKFSKKFVITKDEALKINTESVFKVRISSWINSSIHFLSIANVLLLILIFLLWRKKHE